MSQCSSPSVTPTARPGAGDDRVGGKDQTVLLLAEAFPPDPLSGAARPGRFFKFLPEFRYSVVAISGSRTHAVDPADPDRVHRVPRPSIGRRARVLAGLCRTAQRWLLPYDDMLPWAAHAVIEAETVLAQHSVVAVVSTSPPVGAHLAALWLKRRHGLPWVADFRDPLCGNPFRTRRWFFPYDAWAQELILRHADALVANTDTAAELWQARRPDLAGKASVIWNGFDPEDAVEALPTPPGPRRVLAHVGSLYGGRHPAALLTALERLIRANELNAADVLVRLVGAMEEGCLDRSRDAVDALRAWGCLEYDGRSVPPAAARRAAAEAHYLLLLDLNEQGTDLQVPAKLFEYIRIGRPILAFTRKGSPTERILKGSGIPCRIVYSGCPATETDREVRALFGLPAEPSRPSTWFQEVFDGINQTRSLANLIDSIRGLTDRISSPSGPPGSSTQPGEQ